ncbi:hypothetical protein CYMTET_27513 [Cymbomonas tetramitiformis]|uniref:Uncharacterized protein n=1 Tax=Cymbomonas tetramitiformis TaxID=36881 RepID=A0AAE0FPQ9_9CHLO|nr:hypothetical protein CYMTET_27513 [Cymbomonas tetramitiformis]
MRHKTDGRVAALPKMDFPEPNGSCGGDAGVVFSPTTPTYRTPPTGPSPDSLATEAETSTGTQNFVRATEFSSYLYTPSSVGPRQAVFETSPASVETFESTELHTGATHHGFPTTPPGRNDAFAQDAHSNTPVFENPLLDQFWEPLGEGEEDDAVKWEFWGEFISPHSQDPTEAASQTPRSTIEATSREAPGDSPHDAPEERSHRRVVTGWIDQLLETLKGDVSPKCVAKTAAHVGNLQTPREPEEGNAAARLPGLQGPWLCTVPMDVMTEMLDDILHMNASEMRDDVRRPARSCSVSPEKASSGVGDDADLLQSSSSPGTPQSGDEGSDAGDNLARGAEKAKDMDIDLSRVMKKYQLQQMLLQAALTGQAQLQKELHHVRTTATSENQVQHEAELAHQKEMQAKMEVGRRSLQVSARPAHAMGTEAMLPHPLSRPG